MKGKNNCFGLRYSSSVEILDKKHNSDSGSETVVLKSSYPSEHIENQIIPLEIVKGGSNGTILCLHGLGNRCLKHIRWFPKNFAKKGYSSAIMTLPYHAERTPPGKKPDNFFLEADRYNVLNRFENSVVDIMTCVNYLSQNNSGPVYLFGFSLGGFVSTIAAALIPEIKAVSLAVSGGNFYYMTWKSISTKLLRIQYENDGNCNEKICSECHHEKYNDFINKLPNAEIPVGETPMACYEFDPLTYAPFVKQPVLMQSALLDMFIPKKSTRELYNRLPNVTLKWLPTGHLTSILLRKYMLNQTDLFFRNV